MADTFWVDGIPCNSVPADDRGLCLADGVFETMRVEGGVVCLPALHAERLAMGLGRLGFSNATQLATDTLEESINRLFGDALQAHQGFSGSLRITVTRGSGPRGYAPPESPKPRVILRLSGGLPGPLPAARLGFSPINWSDQPYFAGSKLLARTEQVVASRAMTQQGVDDVIMCDDQGRPCSTTAGNLFARAGTRLITPPIFGCGIAGTRRHYLLSFLGQALGYQTEESYLTKEELLAAREVFFCNSIQGIRSVAAIEDALVGEVSAAERLAPYIHGEAVTSAAGLAAAQT